MCGREDKKLEDVSAMLAAIGGGLDNEWSKWSSPARVDGMDRLVRMPKKGYGIEHSHFGTSLVGSPRW